MDSAAGVLMISPQFHPIVGGYERAAGRLSAALAAAGLRVVVIAERRDRVWPAVERVEGYDVRRLYSCYSAHFHMITSLLSFTAFLLRHGREFAVWHVHQYGVHAALAIALGRLLRRPVVLKLTSSRAMGIESAMGKGIVGRIVRRLHRQAGACIATTEETAREALRFGIPSGRVHLIPNGLDGDRFRPASADDRDSARSALGLTCERLVLCVGRLSPEKNQLGLLHAWAGVPATARDGAVLAIVGDGPDAERISAAVNALALEDSVHLAGARSDVQNWYRAGDVYVISSEQEGLSNTMIEAMASGLPVISTRVSGSSILTEAPAAGVVVDVGDVGMLSRVIEALLSDETARAQLGRNARTRFESRFSIVRVAQQTMLLYDGLGKLPEQPRDA